MDADFAETSAGRWLFSHAWEYGFALSFPEGKESERGYFYEPWHYRYVGRSGGHDSRLLRGKRASFPRLLRGEKREIRQSAPLKI
jgi:hypothetical protein